MAAEYPVWVCLSCDNETCGEDPYMSWDNDEGEQEDVCRECLAHNTMRRTGNYKLVSGG